MSSPIHDNKEIGPALAYAPPWAHYRTHPDRRRSRAIKCPKCEARLILFRPLNPSIDSCGFKSHSIKCETCEVRFAGIIDPYDEVWLLSEPILLDRERRRPPLA
jgi:hypothetical protein